MTELSVKEILRNPKYQVLNRDSVWIHLNEALGYSTSNVLFSFLMYAKMVNGLTFQAKHPELLDKTDLGFSICTLKRCIVALKRLGLVSTSFAGLREGLVYTIHLDSILSFYKHSLDQGKKYPTMDARTFRVHVKNSFSRLEEEVSTEIDLEKDLPN